MTVEATDGTYKLVEGTDYKIKYSDNREKIIDETLKVTRFLLTNVMDVKEESLNEIDECFSK